LRCCNPATTRSSRLVADVRELRPRQARRLARDGSQIDVVDVERLAPRVNTKNGLAPGQVRRRHEQLPVEAAGAQQRRIEILNPVRGAHDHHLFRTVEAVELDEQLIERLILLAVETVPGALRTDSVELIDEDDRRRVLPRLPEEPADPRSTESREHLDERRGRRAVEARARLIRDGFGEERLPGARRSVEKKAFRHLCAQALETLGVAHELDDLHELGPHLLDAGDVGPARPRLAALCHVGRRSARHQADGLPQQPDHQNDESEEEQRHPRRGEVQRSVKPVSHHLCLLIGSNGRIP